MQPLLAYLLKLADEARDSRFSFHGKGGFAPPYQRSWKRKTRRYAHHDAKKARCSRGRL